MAGYQRLFAAALYGALALATPAVASTPCVPLSVTEGPNTAATLDPDQSTFTIASLNLAGRAEIADALETWIRTRLFDIILLQEVGHRSIDGEAFMAALSDRLGFHFAYAPADVLDDAHTQGLAIVSRYPLDDVRVYQLKYHKLRFKSRCRIGLVATVGTAKGPVRLVNIHLDTRINSSDRVAQLTPLLDALGPVDLPQIIGGDFNTMDIRWFRTMWPLPYVQRQSAAIRARLAEVGFHTPLVQGRPTFKFLSLPLRLDWLYLKELQAVEWNVDEVRHTDHRGVWARVSP
jgi:endonuclease/exonuclease/phosphatase family metal-dependent hydrolase